MPANIFGGNVVGIISGNSMIDLSDQLLTSSIYNYTGPLIQNSNTYPSIGEQITQVWKEGILRPYDEIDAGLDKWSKDAWEHSPIDDQMDFRNQWGGGGRNPGGGGGTGYGGPQLSDKNKNLGKLTDPKDPLWKEIQRRNLDTIFGTIKFHQDKTRTDTRYFSDKDLNSLLWYIDQVFVGIKITKFAIKEALTFIKDFIIRKLSGIGLLGNIRWFIEDKLNDLLKLLSLSLLPDDIQYIDSDLLEEYFDLMVEILEISLKLAGYRLYLSDLKNETFNNLTYQQRKKEYTALETLLQSKIDQLKELTALIDARRKYNKKFHN